MANASGKAATQTEKASQQGSKNSSPPNPSLKLVLADSQAIYRVGIRKIFALEDDIRVVAQAETLEQMLTAAGKFQPDVILFECAIAPNPSGCVAELLKRAPAAKIVMITGESGEEDTVEYLRRGVKGIVNRTIAPDLLVKCVRKVAEGETWLDNQGVNWVIDAYRNQAQQLIQPKPKTRLTDKELLIVSCVAQGMKNKEIAAEVGTTEQVVKNYLRKVYDKLGVSDRLELALYCIHHRLLHGSRAESVAAQAEEQKAAANAAANAPPLPNQKM